MENSDFVSDSELTTHVNNSGCELHECLVTADIYSVATQTLTITGAESYSLDAAFFRVLQVVRVDGDTLIPLRQIDVRQRTNFLTNEQPDAGAWLLMGSSIYLYPKPSSGTYKVLYIPQWTALSSGSDSVTIPNGWDEYIVVDCAIKCLAKEESGTDHLQAERDRLLERIYAAAHHRQWADPAQVQLIDEYEYAADPADYFPRRPA
jgi:hypothetical protein